MKNIVTITNTFLMGKALERIYKYFQPTCCNYYHLTFQQIQSHLSSKLFHKSDLFILELFKNYDGKFRAEGVTAGEKIVGKAKQIFIISPLSLPEQFDTLFYWDVKSKIDFENKIQQLNLSPICPSVAIKLGAFAISDRTGIQKTICSFFDRISAR